MKINFNDVFYLTQKIQKSITVTTINIKITETFYTFLVLSV